MGVSGQAFYQSESAVFGGSCPSKPGRRPTHCGRTLAEMGPVGRGTKRSLRARHLNDSLRAEQTLQPCTDAIVILLRQHGSAFSPLAAANATFALLAGLWFQQGRLLMLPPARGSMAAVRSAIHLYPLSNSPNHLSNRSFRRLARAMARRWKNDLLAQPMPHDMASGSPNQ